MNVIVGILHRLHLFSILIIKDLRNPSTPKIMFSFSQSQILHFFYVQGMNEVLAPIHFVFSIDTDKQNIVSTFIV